METNPLETGTPARSLEAAQQKVRLPGLAIYFVSIAATAVAVIGTAAVMFPILVGQNPQGGTLGQLTSTISIVGPLLAAKHAVAAIGAWELVRLRSYGWSLVGVIAALIPTDPIAVMLGLPLGLWALLVLSDGEVRSAFSRKRHPAVV